MNAFVVMCHAMPLAPQPRSLNAVSHSFLVMNATVLTFTPTPALLVPTHLAAFCGFWWRSTLFCVPTNGDDICHSGGRRCYERTACDILRCIRADDVISLPFSTFYYNRCVACGLSSIPLPSPFMRHTLSVFSLSPSVPYLPHLTSTFSDLPYHPTWDPHSVGRRTGTTDTLLIYLCAVTTAW